MRKKILLIDDHGEARLTIRRLLADHSEWVICGEGENGLEAVEKAAALKPDIVILDLSMPKMNGLEAARIIHRASPTLPLLLFSINAETLAAKDIRAAGFQGCVSKATAWLLTDAVEALLEGGTFFGGPSAALGEAKASESLQNPAVRPQNGDGASPFESNPVALPISREVEGAPCPADSDPDLPGKSNK